MNSMPTVNPHPSEVETLILALRPDLRQIFEVETPRGNLRYLGWQLLHGVREYRALREDMGFRAHLAEIDPGLGVPRIVAGLWALRTDLQTAFPLPARREALEDWFLGQEVHRLGLLPLLGPALLGRAQALDPVRTGRWLEEAALALLEEDDLKQHERPWGVNLIGYAHGQLGIGEDVRMAARALHAAGVPFTVLNFQPGADVGQNDHSIDAWVGTEAPYAINLFCLTAEQHGRFLAERGLALRRGRHNIGFWPWELGRWPEAWSPVVAWVDEIWSASRHTAEAVAALSAVQDRRVPVRRMPMAVALEPGVARVNRRAVRARHGLPDQACLFAFTFDLNSSIHRKNPQAAVAAFQAAFGQDASQGPAVGLVIKVHPPRREEPVWDELKRLARQDARLHLIEETLSRPDLLALYAACDAFVSLHRAEGYGRAIAEALQLGLHVVTTGYSGNLDFCESAQAAPQVDLVPYRLVSVEAGQYPHGEGQCWAEPDVAHAAARMQAFAERRLALDQDPMQAPYAKRRGGWPQFGLKPVGRCYARRLQEIRAQWVSRD